MRVIMTMTILFMLMVLGYGLLTRLFPPPEPSGRLAEYSRENLRRHLTETGYSPCGWKVDQDIIAAAR